MILIYVTEKNSSYFGYYTILEGIITAQAHLMVVSINTKTFCVSHRRKSHPVAVYCQLKETS